MRILIELWLRPFCQGIIGTTAALLGIGLASAAGSAASGIMGSNAASKAAQDQSQTALQVAQLQSQDANKALNFQESQYNDAVARMQPWLRTGSGATNILDRLMGMSPQFLNSATPGTPSQSSPLPSNQVPMVGSGSPPGIGPVPSVATGTGNRFLPFQATPNSGQTAMFDPNNPHQPGTNSAPGTEGPQGPLNVNATPGQNPTMIANGPSGTVPRTDGGTTTPSGSSGGAAGMLGADGQSLPDFNPGPGTLNLGSPQASNGDTTGLPDGFLSQVWNKQFQAPDAITEQNDPGYQARLKLGSDTMERSAAARGNLMTGGEAKNLDQFAQDYASNEYGNVYNRSYNQYTTDYNQFKQNQNDIFNRYATLAGYGQTAAGQLNSQGVATGGQVGNTLLTSGAQIGSDLNASAAARASGYVGSSNAISGAISGGVNSTMDLLAMYQAMQKHA